MALNTALPLSSTAFPSENSACQISSFSATFTFQTLLGRTATGTHNAVGELLFVVDRAYPFVLPLRSPCSRGLQRQDLLDFASASANKEKESKWSQL